MTGDSQTGVKPNLSADDLIGSLPQLAQLADIEIRQLVQKPSGALTIGDIAQLAAGVRNATQRGVDGIVVIQGTDTIEETAFALDLMVQASCPVVITGAMRNPSMAGSDGDAFKSTLCGPVGRIVEDRVVLFTKPFERKPFKCDLNQLVEIPPVALLASSIHDDGRLVSAAADSGYKAIVLGAMGAGHVSPEVADRLEEAALQIPVVFCSRSSSGQVCKLTYGYPGGEMDLLRRGLISAGWLPPLKAKVLTALALAHNFGKEEVSVLLQHYDGGTG